MDKKDVGVPVTEVVSIPDKMFFKIREVSQIAEVKPHVLRYWESEFPTLSPRKNRNGQRMYTRKDVEMALDIKKLLHVERYSIAGARQRLKKRRGTAVVTAVSTSTSTDAIKKARDDIANLLDSLKTAP